MSPVFDVCRELLVVEIAQRRVVDTRSFALTVASPHERLAALAALALDVLV